LEFPKSELSPNEVAAEVSTSMANRLHMPGFRIIFNDASYLLKQWHDLSSSLEYVDICKISWRISFEEMSKGLVTIP
jgi:hypothetical protein